MTARAAGTKAGKAQSETVGEVLRREHKLYTGRRYAPACRLLERLLARRDLSRSQRFEALCRKAECMERLGRARSSVDLLRDIARTYPDEPLGHSLLGEYLYRVSEDIPGSLEALKKALALRQDDPDTLWWMGQVYQNGLGDLARARRSYQAALQSDGKYSPAMEALAGVCEAQGRWIEAIEWRKAHYLRTRQSATLVSISDLYLRVGNAGAALKYIRLAVRRNPSAAAWLTLAKSCAALGSLGRAKAALARYGRLVSPRTGPHIHPRDAAWLEPLLADPSSRAILARFAAP